MYGKNKAVLEKKNDYTTPSLCNIRVGKKGIHMAAYGYVVLDKTGKEKKGSMQAESEADVQKALRDKGFMIVEITKQSLLTQDLSIDLGGKVTNRDLSVFCRQFVSMMRAGVAIIEALELLGEQTENKKLQKAIQSVQATVEKGGSLSEGMKEFPKVFPSLMVNTIGAGEASGSLEVSFERMAVQFEKSAKTQAAVKKAMIYPIIVAVVAVVVVVVFMVKIIPGYRSMFDSLGTDLPKLTQIVVNFSDFMVKRWYVLLIIIGLIAAGIYYFANTKTGQHFFGRFKINMPIFGKMNVKSASSLLARTLSTLISSGVPLEEAVEITARVMPNILYKEALYEARNQVLQGLPLSRPLEECGLFPPMVYHMIRIGEESGSLEDMLGKLADYYDDEVEMSTQAAMAAMEPLIIIVLAAVVGTLIGAVLAPMLKMYQTIDQL